MPQSLSKVIVHIIFSTKGREPWLDSSVRPRMHAYLATVCRDLGAEVVHVGGVADHVHIVTTLPRTVSQAQLVEQIKKTSSKWIKTVGANHCGFSWQRGYAAFPLVLVSSRPCCSTPRRKKSITALARFKRNTANYCARTASISTSGMCGIKKSPVKLTRAFSA